MKGLAKAVIRLCICAGWSELLLVAHTTLLEILCHGSFHFHFCNLFSRTIKSVLSVWMDTYPEDFREPPGYPCLHYLENFAKQNIPESDLSIRVRHKIEKFKKEDLGKSGTVTTQKFEPR